MKRAYELQIIRFMHSPLLMPYIEEGMSFQGLPAHALVYVIAVVGWSGRDWAVYIDVHPDIAAVIDWGLKLPKETAEKLFPHWVSDRGMKYRP